MTNTTNDGRRKARIEREVQHALAQFLLSGYLKDEIQDCLSEAGLVTVSSVRMPMDFKTAKVYVSVLGKDSEKKKVLSLLDSRRSEAQSHIGSQLKLRYIPRLTFLLDETMEKVLKVEKIISDLSKARSVDSESRGSGPKNPNSDSNSDSNSESED